MEENKSIEISNLNVQLESLEKEKYKLEKKIISPVVVDLVYAVSASIILNSIANLHDHYSLLEFIKYCIIDIPLNMPVGLILSYFVYELNKEKKEKISDLNNKISEIKSTLNIDETLDINKIKTRKI